MPGDASPIECWRRPRRIAILGLWLTSPRCGGSLPTLRSRRPENCPARHGQLPIVTGPTPGRGSKIRSMAKDPGWSVKRNERKVGATRRPISHCVLDSQTPRSTRQCTTTENAKAIFPEAVEKHSPDMWPSFSTSRAVTTTNCDSV